MTWALLILAALLVLTAVAAWQLGKSRRAALEQVAALGREVAARDHVIKAMEAANAQASARKDSMAAGTDSDRFGASLDVLHDISGGGAKPAAAGLADVPGPGRPRNPRG